VKKVKNSFFFDIREDARVLFRHAPAGGNLSRAVWLLGSTDAYWILVMQRLREFFRRNHIPFVGRILRMLQLILYGIEISPHARIGHGVYFVHSVGVVIGGNAVVGKGTMFLGSNTLGTVHCENYPVVGCDVVIGAGARILDGTNIGDGAMIGANAVVTKDVPHGAVAVGIPARVVSQKA
jgi:serine O-acetyltransferase